MIHSDLVTFWDRADGRVDDGSAASAALRADRDQLCRELECTIPARAMAILVLWYALDAFGRACASRLVSIGQRAQRLLAARIKSRVPSRGSMSARAPMYDRRGVGTGAGATTTMEEPK